MKANDFLTDAEQDLIKQAYDSSTQLELILHNAVSAGFPYQEHLDKSREQTEWLEKIRTMFGTQ